jgi:hypothetical protein
MPPHLQRRRNNHPFAHPLLLFNKRKPHKNKTHKSNKKAEAQKPSPPLPKQKKTHHNTPKKYGDKAHTGSTYM